MNRYNVIYSENHEVVLMVQYDTEIAARIAVEAGESVGYSVRIFDYEIGQFIY